MTTQVNKLCTIDCEHNIQYNHRKLKFTTSPCIEKKTRQLFADHSFCMAMQNILDRESRRKFRATIPSGIFLKESNKGYQLILFRHLKHQDQISSFELETYVVQGNEADDVVFGNISVKQIKEGLVAKSIPRITLSSTYHGCTLDPVTNIITHQNMGFKLSRELVLGMEGTRGEDHQIPIDLLCAFLKKHAKKFKRQQQEYSEYLRVIFPQNKERILNGVINFYTNMQKSNEPPFFIFKTAYFTEEWQLKNRLALQKDAVGFDLWKKSICYFEMS